MDEEEYRRQQERAQGMPVDAGPSAGPRPGRGGEGASFAWLAALPDFCLAALFGLDQFAGITVSFMPDEWLRSLMALQFLVVHSFPFLMTFALIRPRNSACRWGRGVFFWGLSLFYLRGSFQLGGLPGLSAFVGLSFSTYLGFLLRLTRPGAGFDLTVRWLVSFLLFITGAIAFDTPQHVEEWPAFPGILRFGFSYFLALGVLEGLGVYRCRLLLAVRGLVEEARLELKKGPAEERSSAKGGSGGRA